MWNLEAFRGLLRFCGATEDSVVEEHQLFVGLDLDGDGMLSWTLELNPVIHSIQTKLQENKQLTDANFTHLSACSVQIVSQVASRSNRTPELAHPESTHPESAHPVEHARCSDSSR